MGQREKGKEVKEKRDKRGGESGTQRLMGWDGVRKYGRK